MQWIQIIRLMLPDMIYPGFKLVTDFYRCVDCLDPLYRAFFYRTSCHQTHDHCYSSKWNTVVFYSAKHPSLIWEDQPDAPLPAGETPAALSPGSRTSSGLVGRNAFLFSVYLCWMSASMEAADSEWLGVQVVYVGAECIHPLSPDKYFMCVLAIVIKRCIFSVRIVWA